MMRKIKALGIAVGATLALSAALASAAQAETGVLTTQQYPAILTADQAPGGVTWDIGEPPLQQVTCVSQLDGTLVGPSDPVTFRPTYGNCISDPAGTPVTVTTNGCDYRIGFTRPGTTGWSPTTGTMQAWLFCPAGQQIEIHVYENAVRHAENVSTCTYDIGPQGPVPAGVYHNTNMGIADVDMTINAKFTARSTIGAGGMLCGGDPITQHLPITLTGNYTLRAWQDFNGVEGAQIPVDVG
jgi:hypothetical protein